MPEPTARPDDTLTTSPDVYAHDIPPPDTAPTPLPFSGVTQNPFELPALPLLAKPTNDTTRRIFIAATRMNDGKTTTCLGLYAALQTIYPRVGFIKPVGQRFVDVQGQKIDEDTVLLDTIYQVRVPIESMSPVAVDGTFTRRFITAPETLLPVLEDKICRAFDRVSWEKDFTIIEGSGHAGVGSVFDLSNARVAQLLGAKVVLVVPGGIGRPVDEAALNKALFDKSGVEVIGAIINKVEPDKTDIIRDYAGRGLERLGIPLLGIIPVQKVLSAPNLSQISEEIDGRWLNGRRGGARQRVLRVVIGAMAAKGIVDYLQPGTLIITPGDRDDIILAALSCASLAGGSTIAGLVVTNDIKPHPKMAELLAQTDIPVIAAKDDAYRVTARINNMHVKTQPQDTDKIPIIKSLITDHVDLHRLLASV
ncbi:MAG: AAA family ATPase [Opitutaceae bacterium]|jgi:BioD-like phosphotransacetylase family protein|nr:AAA family ATPase [Opitutaceae bacterium]